MQLSLAPDDILWTAPRQSRAIRAFVLAVLMHGLLFLFFYFGLHWQTSTPAAVEAELWSALPQIEAPKPVEITQDKPVNKPAKPLKAEEPILKPAIQPTIKPDIALEKERQKKLQQLKEIQAAKEKQDQEQLKKQQEENRRKTLASMGITANNPHEGGNAMQTSGPSGEWSGAVAAAIRANINYDVPADLKGNPEAIFLIKLLPSGEMIGAPKLLQSSGLKPYDEAVERAIRKTDPLPRPKNGIIERELKLKFRPLDKP